MATLGGQKAGEAASLAAPVSIGPGEHGGYVCTAPAYRAELDAGGNLRSLRVGPTECLAGPAAFVHAGQFVKLKTVRQTGPDAAVAEGESMEAGKGPAARIAYHFQPNRIELVLQQKLDHLGGFAWLPSPSVLASRDALTDCPVRPGAKALYGQTDPRWITREGPVLRFDFGVWQRSFANANWSAATVDGRVVTFMQNTVVAAPIKVTIYPIASPAPRDALTFDISAASPDFLLPKGRPVHFEIRVGNAGPGPLESLVRFEVRDYLTRKPLGSKSTRIKLAGQAAMLLPTDVAVERPGPYRAAIVVDEAGPAARSVGWVFAYDFEHYAPETTRPADFAKFWSDARAESAATPLDAKLTPAPEKSTAAANAFKISFATLGGRRIYGWYARPKAPGKYPVQIRFPSSGIYPLAGPQIYPDRLSLWIVIHGFDVDLANMPAGPDPGKDYWTAGIESPQTSMWRTIFISLVRAVDFMLAQPEADPGRVVVVGGSQGGGLSMVAAALDSRIGLCMPSHSGLPRLDWTVKYEPGYWPFTMQKKPAGQSEEQFLNTLAYFDPANFTPDIRCPVVAEIGLMDTVTAAGNQLCALAHVPRDRLCLICSPWAMHGGGSRAPQLGAACYARFLRGQPPIPAPPPR
jgi:cephalosporin-C deacetylase-like acetyl esterase